METINIHWSIAFVLPLVGAFIARRYHGNWRAWITAAGMSLVSFLMITLIGYGTFEYALAVLVAMWLVGAFLPDIWHGVSTAVRAWLSRPRNVLYLVAGVIGLSMFFYRPDLLAKLVVIWALFLIGRQMVRKFIKF